MSQPRSARNLDNSAFWRTLPWDHAPGALLASEAGGRGAHFDAEPYRPGRAGFGLLAAADPETHGRVAAALALRSP